LQPASGAFARLTQRRARRRRLRVVALAATACVLAVLVGTAALLPRGRPPLRSAQRAVPGIRVDYRSILAGKIPPFPGAEQVSLDEAQRRFGKPLVVPDSALASTACLTKAWVAPFGPSDRRAEVVLIFSTHIGLYLTKSDREFTADELRLDAKKFGPALASVTCEGPAPALQPSGLAPSETEPEDMRAMTRERRIMSPLPQRARYLLKRPKTQVSTGSRIAKTSDGFLWFRFPRAPYLPPKASLGMSRVLGECSSS
jgi:hypothetical protein